MAGAGAEAGAAAGAEAADAAVAVVVVAEVEGVAAAAAVDGAESFSRRLLRLSGSSDINQLIEPTKSCITRV